MTEKRFLNTREASLYTGVPVSTLRKYRMEDRGPKWTKPEGRVLYLKADLDEWLESGSRIPAVRVIGH
jgi:predicted DNA-binding transcriptional regulator AlpA